MIMVEACTAVVRRVIAKVSYTVVTHVVLSNMAKEAGVRRVLMGLGEPIQDFNRQQQPDLNQQHHQRGVGLRMAALIVKEHVRVVVVMVENNL